MNEIEVGEWVRTEEGNIYKVKRWQKPPLYDSEWIYTEKYGYLNPYYCDYSKLKHSKNKIDLVEVGDYVNGKRIHTITTDKHLLTERNENILDKYRDIETLVTHEQFKEREYIF